MEQSGTQIASPSEWVKKNIIRKLKEKKRELGKSPSKRNVDGSLARAARKHFGSWNRAKEKASLETFEFKGKGGKNWSKEKIVDKLRELACELDRSPVVADDRNLASAAQRYFESWNDAKRAAGLEVFPAPKDRNWSEERVIDELKELAEELGRAPKAADDYNLTQAARRYFESWNQALEAADVDSIEPEEGATSVSLSTLEDREKAFEEVLRDVENILPSGSADRIRKKAAEIFYSIDFFKGHSLHGLVLGCIYLSCRFNRVVVFPDELAEEALAEEKERKAVRKIAKVIRQETKAPSPQPFKVEKIVGRFVHAAGFEEKVLESAVELAKKSTDKLNLSGRPRRGLAAAVLYIVGCLHPDCDKLTQVEVGNVCGVSGASIGNNLHILCGVLNREDLPFIPHPPVRRYSSTVREAFVEAGDVERSILHKIRKLTDELGRPPYMKDDEYLAQAARERFGSWNWAKRKAGLETFKR